MNPSGGNFCNGAIDWYAIVFKVSAFFTNNWRSIYTVKPSHALLSIANTVSFENPKQTLKNSIVLKKRRFCNTFHCKIT